MPSKAKILRKKTRDKRVKAMKKKRLLMVRKMLRGIKGLDRSKIKIVKKPPQSVKEPEPKKTLLDNIKGIFKK